MSTRILVRVVVPSSFRVVKPKPPRSIATSTYKICKKNASSYVTSSSFVDKKQERRLYSEQKPAVVEEMTVDFDYVKKAMDNADVLIVDVREPEEVKEHGKIPNSINIPLSNVVPVLSEVTDNKFKQLYGREKPTENTEIIFYCMIGKRSGKAQQNALSLGYKNAKNYLGSWTDWATKNQ